MLKEISPPLHNQQMFTESLLCTWTNAKKEEGGKKEGIINNSNNSSKGEALWFLDQRESRVNCCSLKLCCLRCCYLEAEPSVLQHFVELKSAVHWSPKVSLNLHKLFSNLNNPSNKIALRAAEAAVRPTLTQGILVKIQTN